MWVVFLLLLLLLPQSISVHAEDLGELSANPARLSCLSGLFGFFGLSGGDSDPDNKTIQIDQTNQMNRTNSPRRPLSHMPSAPVPNINQFEPPQSSARRPETGRLLAFQA